MLAQLKSSKELNQNSIKFGIDKTYEPYEFVNANGKSDGFNVEIIKAIGHELDREVEIVPDDWINIRRKLEVSDKIDIAAYFKNSSRIDSLLFSRPFGLLYYSIFTRSDEDPVEDLFALDRKKVAIQEATIVEEYFDQLGFLSLKALQKYKSEADAIQAVVEGRADCAITTFMTTNYKMEKENITNIQSSSDPVFVTEYCFAVTMENAALMDSLNWGLRLIKASGEYDRIYQKWLTPKKSWWDENLDLIVMIVLVLFLLGILAIIYIYSLRNLVKKKSKAIKKEIKSRTVTEWELIQSENLRKKMEEFTSVMLVETDLEHNIVQAPKLFFSLLGFADSDLVGVNLHQILSEKSAAKDKEIKLALLERDFSYLDAEYEYKSSENVPVWMESSTSLRFDENKRVIGFKQFLRDITPLKKANLGLKDLNAELANFMYKTSHDVRGPIANVLGLVNLGNMKTEDPEVRTYLDLIAKSTGKLEHIFDDFKEVSFILHGELNITTFDFKALINEVLESIFLKRNKELKKANIQIHIHSDSNFVTSDRALLKRLCYQLIENVFEHNTYYDTKLSITYEKENSLHYSLCFEDDGIGIPDDLQKKVFEVFFKGKRSDLNVGMGLYMAKKVVNRLSGDMKLKSVLEKGTRIKITLPVLQRNEIFMES